MTESAAGSGLNRTREEAVEDLIAVLEMAAVHHGWIYRSSGRYTSNMSSLAARLRSAHAAYTLASNNIKRTTVARLRR
jgi:hypothetical protein